GRKIFLSSLNPHLPCCARHHLPHCARLSGENFAARNAIHWSRLGNLSSPWPGLSRPPSVPSMLDSSEVQVLYPASWSDGLANLKSVAARRGLKEAWSKAATRWTR